MYFYGCVQKLYIVCYDVHTMPEQRSAVISKQRTENTKTITELALLTVSAVVVIVGVLVLALKSSDVLPFVTPYRLYIAMTVASFAIVLSAFGLMYKAIRLSRQLKYARRNVNELRNLSDVRETFIGMAEHRLRTPISGIRWGIGALQDSGNLNEEEREILDKMKDKAKTANDLLEKLLKMQHFELYDFQLSEKKDTKDLTTLINEILDDLQYLVEQSNTDVQFDDSLKVALPCDEYLLRSALTNLLDNSIRYSPGGTVRISLRPHEEGVQLVVADNGIGMTPTEKKHLFERFYRGERAQQIDPHQTGIGMYLTKQVIGLHGGTIDVQSAKKEGTTFRITLPTD